MFYEFIIQELNDLLCQNELKQLFNTSTKFNEYKKIFLYQKHPIFKASEKRIYNRSSVVPKILTQTEIKIYSGKSWFTRSINK